MSKLYLARGVRVFCVTLTIWCGKLEDGDSMFHYYAHWRIHFVLFTCEVDGTIIIFLLLHLFFLIVVLYEYVYLITCFSCMLQLLDANQDRQSFCRNTRMKLWLSEKGCNNLWIIELKSSWYVGFQQFLFLSYYYFLNLLTFFFSRKYITPGCKREQGWSFDPSGTRFKNMIGGRIVWWTW